jgi:hypothetical protein
LGQKEHVDIYSPYVQNTIDDRQKKKHIEKCLVSQNITGDEKVDAMYQNAIMLSIEEQFERIMNKN